MNRSMGLAGIALTVLVALGAGPSFPKGADEDAINKRVEGLYAALAKGDVKAYVESFHENGVRTIIGPVDIEEIIGPAEIEQVFGSLNIKTVQGLYAALAKGDLKAYVESLHENAVRAANAAEIIGPAEIEKIIGPVDVEEIIGPVDIEAAAAEALAQGGLAIEFTRHATWLLSSTTALVHGSTENVSTNPPTKGHSMLTLVKAGDEWLVTGLQEAVIPFT